jgi:hypothetical protein
MIQRFQSLFLLLATICLLIALFMPIGTITTNEAQYLFNSWNLHENIPNGKIISPNYINYYIGILQTILALICFIAIFFYKKRPTQSKICIAGIIINFILLLLMLYVYPDRIFQSIALLDKNEVVYNPWAMTSIFSLGFLYLANKFILKDEKKIREADRLR